MRLFLASFLGVLEDRVAFAEEETATLARAKAAVVNPWELMHLAGAHAHVGHPTRALEILRNTLRDGRLLPRAWMTLAAPTLEHTDGFNELLREYDAAQQRLRRQYAPAS